MFAEAPEDCDCAVRHVAQGAVAPPIWLFTTKTPLPDTAELCDRVTVEPGGLRLVLRALLSLRRYWVALSVTAWTGKRESRLLKFAPFLIPPFRVLVMNEHQGFFQGNPKLVFRHLRRRLWAYTRNRFVLAGYLFLHGWGRLVALCHRFFWVCVHLVEGFNAACQRGYWMSFQSAATFGCALSTWRCQVGGLGLLFVAALSRRSTSFARFLLARHGEERLAVRNFSASGAGIAVFEYSQRQADWQVLERLVESSPCRWILLREKGTKDESVEDMLPLFEDQRTFAVSRQPGVRPWSPRLFAQAPFRRLQTGEACQVLAPVSASILVDRRKLRELGVARTCYPGTAWLLTFWKAAAAGFHCYSVAGRSPLGTLPSWPVQESELLVRLLENSSLLALGPRDPDLSRGNISFAIRAAQPLRNRLRVLIVSPYLPYPLTHGGAVRIYNLCRALSDRVDFLLVSFLEKNDRVDYRTLHQLFRKVYVVDREDDPLNDRDLPGQVRQHGSRSMSALIARVCREEPPDLLQVEYTHMASYRKAAPAVPAILVEHDLTFTLYAQLAQLTGNAMARREYRRWLNFERKSFQDYDGVWMVSEEDRAAALREGAPAARTWVVPNGVDIKRLCPGGIPAAGPEILYVGSFRHLPNLIGFETLLVKVMPRVWNHYPAAKLVVVSGSDPEMYLREYHKGRQHPRLDPRVCLNAFVPDLRPLYEKAWVVVAPLVVSAGTNIKVLEAMASGKAIVSTPIAVNGLGLQDDWDVLIRADWSQFAEAVADCLGNPAIRMRLGAEARRTVERRFHWGHIAERAFESYLKLAPAHRKATHEEGTMVSFSTPGGIEEPTLSGS